MEEYEVQEVVDSRVIKGQRQFRIRWKGFQDDDDTWEPESNLTSCPDKLKSFLFKIGELKVQEVLDSRVIKGQRQFLIRWKGFKEDDDTWEPESNLTSCPDKLKSFLFKIGELKVEKILNMRINDGLKEFLIRWKGRGKNDNSWEKKVDLKGYKSLIKCYEDSLKEGNSKKQVPESRMVLKNTPIKGEYPKNSSKETSYRSVVCEKQFQSKEPLDEHAATCKAKKKPEVFSCKLCKYHGNLKMLERHWLAKHSAPISSFLCPICKRSFTRSQTVLYHLPTHKRNVMQETLAIDDGHQVSNNSSAEAANLKKTNPSSANLLSSPSYPEQTDHLVTSADSRAETDTASPLDTEMTLLDEYYDSLNHLKELCYRLCHRFPHDRILAEHRHVFHNLTSNVKIAKANLSLSCIRKKVVIDVPPAVQFGDRTCRSIAPATVTDGGQREIVRYSKNNLTGLVNMQQKRGLVNDVDMAQNQVFGYDISDGIDTSVTLPMEDILCNTTDQHVIDDPTPSVSWCVARSQGSLSFMNSFFSTEQHPPESIFTGADDFLVAPDSLEISEIGQSAPIDSTNTLLPIDDCLLGEGTNPGKDGEIGKAYGSVEMAAENNIKDLAGLLPGEDDLLYNRVGGNHLVPDKELTDKYGIKDSSQPNSYLFEDDPILTEDRTRLKEHAKTPVSRVDPQFEKSWHHIWQSNMPPKTANTQRAAIARRLPARRSAYTSKMVNSKPARRQPTKTKSQATDLPKSKRRCVQRKGSATNSSTPINSFLNVTITHPDANNRKNHITDKFKRNFVTVESDMATELSPSTSLYDSCFEKPFAPVTVEAQPLLPTVPYALMTQTDDCLYATGDPMECEESSHLVCGVRRSPRQSRESGASDQNLSGQMQVGTDTVLEGSRDIVSSIPMEVIPICTRYTCKQCDYGSQYRSTLLRHIAKKHPQHLSSNVKPQTEKENQSIDNNKIIA